MQAWKDLDGEQRIILKQEVFQRLLGNPPNRVIFSLFCEWIFDMQRDGMLNCEPRYDPGELADTSISHRERVKSIVSGFAKSLIDEALLTRNPTRGIEFPA